MPYQQSSRLPQERASRLGHLDILNSPLVKEIVHTFENVMPTSGLDQRAWHPLPSDGDPLPYIFAVDGSLQILRHEAPPHKALSFIKTSLMHIDQPALARLDKEFPHPFALRDFMQEAALYHATVFPLRHVRINGTTVYHAIRRIIFDSIKDPSPAIQGQVMETLKWLAYEKWTNEKRDLPRFRCPHLDCATDSATLPYDSEDGPCPVCGKTIYLTDFLGFHLDMVEDGAADVIATSYMSVHESLLLFTGIRHFWETNRETLKNCLFLKDGPLQIRAQYSKLVQPIRRFLVHAAKEGVPINLVGQEKTGLFVEHLDLIKREAPPDSFFIPAHKYICEQVQHRPADSAPYGKDTNYGVKVFVSMKRRYFLVLNVPITEPMAEFILSPDETKLLGWKRIMATLPSMLSSRHENALVPIELAHSIASLSTYPSAQVLKLFAATEMKKS